MTGGARSRAPNVLLIVCDQLNASVLSPYGGPVDTPNLARLAGRGVVFRNATCPAAICSPSRASIVTGRYPHAHGILHNLGGRDYPAIPSPPGEEGIEARDTTTERILHENGYSTHHYGKWHLSGDVLPYYPDTFGEHIEYADSMSDVFQAVRERPREHWMDWYGWALPVQVPDDIRAVSGRLTDQRVRSRFGDFVSKMGRLELPLEQNFDVMVADRAIERLGRLGPEPFMITCSFNAPHDPNVVPSPYDELFQPDDIRLPANSGSLEDRFEEDPSRRIAAALGEAGVRAFLRIYYGAVRLVDDQVGRVLDALESTGRSEDTIIVFLTDHGDMAGSHGMVWKSTSAFYDEVVRIPLMISYPREIAAGRVDEEPASLVDVMPTLLDLAGFHIPDSVQGQSLRPSMTGSQDPSGRAAYSFCERLREHPGHLRDLPPDMTRGSFMIRSREWKYARYPDGAEYLYDLSGDPGETVNLAGEARCRSQRSRLRQELDAWLDAAAGPGG